LAIKGQLNIL